MPPRSTKNSNTPAPNSAASNPAATSNSSEKTTAINAGIDNSSDKGNNTATNPDAPALLSGRANVKRQIRGLLSSSTSEAAISRRNPDALVVKLERLRPNPDQPRRQFDPAADEELAADIAQRGVLEPLLVRAVDEDEAGPLYQIIAGERRYRAAHSAGLVEVPVVVRNLDDRETALTALVENLQRTDLLPQDEGRFFRELQNRYNLTNRAIATLISKSEAYVSKRLHQLDNPGVADRASEEGSLAERPGDVSRETSVKDGEKNHNTLQRQALREKSQTGKWDKLPSSRSVRTALSKTVVRLGELGEVGQIVFEESHLAKEEARGIVEAITEAQTKLAALKQQLTRQIGEPE